jgi:hypothetical protein
MEIRDVIFLGAGASASEGASLQKDLFKEYFLNQTGRNNRISSEMKERLTGFFEKFFGINTEQGNSDSNVFPTFEEVLGILELSLKREESFKGYCLTPDRPNTYRSGEDSSGRPSIQRIREDMIFLIAIILDQKLGRVYTEGYHERLVRRLKNEEKIHKTCFISLNYDILIDNALVNLYPDYDLDYGVYFINFDNSTNPDQWKRPRPGEAVHLYKLHGSLNWLYCPTCRSLALTPKEKGAAKLAFEPSKCRDCQSFMIPIIIPPTFFKIMSNFYLQQVWHEAEKALRQAERIFFCGYSFPDADIHIKYLLKRVEVNRGSTPEIYIINNYEERSCHQREDENLRYKRFFKDSQKICDTGLSFEEFCENGIQCCRP